MATRKYYDTKTEAQKACKTRTRLFEDAHVFKMPKGSRHHDKYAVCTELEFPNTY